MTTGKVICALHFFLWLVYCQNSFGQNLVPNPDFEVYSTCPSWVTQIGLAVPWENASNGSPDYFHVCATEPIVGVPINVFGNQDPHTGEAYAGIILQNSLPPSYREYITAPLLEPLEAGNVYAVGMWVSVADYYCGSDQIGIYFSEEPPEPNFGDMIILEPQFKHTGGLILDSVNWVLLSGCFVPDGGEQWITIGNFTGILETTIDPNCPSGPLEHISYVYLEDIFLYKDGAPETIDLELGDPVQGCDSYLIDPGILNVSYDWSDGSEDSTLLVTESGIYSLSITSGCMQGVDSIEVIIHGDHPVDLGPEEINICEGESYLISLDPHFNEYVWQDGSTASEYIITSTGLYQVTLDDGCEISTDEIQVNVIAPPPPFSLSDETILCPNEQIEFNFDPDIGDFLWQDGSNSSYYSITDSGSYALTISNMCGEEQGSVDVIGLLYPQIFLGPDSLHLCNGQAFDIILDPELAEYQWQDYSYANEYHITTTGQYSVTATNECGDAVDSIDVIFHLAPVFDLGADTMICPGQPSFLLDPGEFWNANYLWQDGSALPEYYVTMDGTYSALITNNCGTYSDTITVDFNNGLPLLDLGPDLSLCPGEQIELSTNISDVHFMWQDSSTANSILVSLPGWYSVFISDACSFSSDSIYISLENNPPELILPSQLNLCIGDSILLDAGITGVSYLWSNGTTAQTLLVKSADEYYLTVSNACGIDIDTIHILNAGLPPSVALGNDIEFCQGEIVILSPQSTNVSTWLWSDGSNSPDFSITTAGNISVIASNSCGVTFDTITAILLPPVPTLSLGPDTAFCSGSSVSFSINNSNVEILWSNGSQDQQLEVFTPGQYSATVSNQCGNANDTVDVSLLPDAPAFDLGADQSICPGEIITIDPEIPNVNYLWQDGSDLTTYSTTQTDTIILTLSNACGSDIDTLYVYESTEGPMVDLGSDVMACVGDTVILNSNISGVDYLWQNGSTSSSFTTINSGAFIIEVSNNCGNDTDTILVDISATIPSSYLGADTMLCSGSSLKLTPNSNIGITFEWQDGSNAPTYIVNTPGIYILTETNLCGIHMDSVRVDFMDAPLPFNLGNDTILCPGEFILLQAPVTSNEILWQDGSNDITMMADKNQVYSLSISNECGFVFDEMNVIIDAHQLVLPSDTTYSLCPNEVIIVDVTQPNNATYLWSTGSDSPAITIVSPGLYGVTIITNCYTEHQHFDVMASPNCNEKVSFFIPNVFSPNGDNINDVFSFQFSSGVDIISLHGAIFDRWGNVVYESSSNPFEWDGNFDKKMLNPGVYCYKINVTYLEQSVEKSELIMGDVLLLR